MGPYQYDMLNKKITEFEWSDDFLIFIKKTAFNILEIYLASQLTNF